MRILSLFDGISGAAQALEELSIDCEYYASEIDKWAIEISRRNHPNIIQLGDVRDIGTKNPYPKELLEKCDLLIFGSPCTDLSIAKRNRRSLGGQQSSLFFEAIRIIKDLKPRYFVMENVGSMSRDAKNEITKCLATSLTQNDKDYEDWELINVDF
jgi:site-specific DNA-cytosine methylase